jgi:PKD repeat protein
MTWMTRHSLIAALGLAALTSNAHAQSQAAETGALLVVYGVDAPSREGDVDHREQILFSVPANTAGRIYVRVFDPEINGRDDFTYGGPRDSVTTFRVMGGEGAFTGATRPKMQSDRDRATATTLVTDPGIALFSRDFDNDATTNGRWVTLGAVRARNGEVIDGRAYFRLDVDGTKGNDGNGFSVGVSMVRDRARAPDGLSMFAYQPTLRWNEGTSATRTALLGAPQGPFTIQNFDGANAELDIVTDYADFPVKASGQDYWSVDTIAADGSNLALSLKSGFETPNDVSISVFDGAGDPVALQMPPFSALDPARPTAVGAARPLADCRAVAFDGNASTGRAPLGYIWDFGDGSNVDQSVIAHRYAEPGRYVATLRVLEDGTRPGRGASVEVPVHVRSGPQAKPGDAIVIAPGQSVGFDGTGSEPSDSPISRYKWSFGDGTTASGATTQKAYEKSGLYRANLRVEDDSAHPCYFGVATRDVTVNFSPIAEAGTDQTAETGQVLGFNGTASYDIDGKIGTYSWAMADGTVLEGRNITHAFAEPGSYTVTLSVIDESGVANDTATDQLIVEVNAPPAPAFSIPERPVSVSEAAELNASASVDVDGEIISYLWEFGDGAMGDGKIVNYAWTSPGVYNVVLTVTDNSGTASATQKFEQEIFIDAAPTAVAGPAQFVTTSEVQFDGTGSTDPESDITSYAWDFGDGTIGTGPKPVHAYVRPGNYEVSLVVTDASGAPLNTDRDTVAITVNASPIADAGPTQIVAPNEEFTLSGRASLDPDGSISEYLWTMPDGKTKAAERIAVSLRSPGLYRFGLTVSDDFRGGAARDTDEALIRVNSAPIAEAGADLLVAPGDPVRLDAGMSFDRDGEITRYSWEFSDGAAPEETAVVERTYDTAGVWSAQLVVTDDSGVLNSTATDGLTIRVNHAPEAKAGADIQTEELQISVDGTASQDADGDQLIYSWNFGDGSSPVMGAQATHVYARSGIYPVTLTVQDGTGLSNATAVDTTKVTIKTRPIAVAGANRDVCSGEAILFDASDSTDPDGGLLLYSWDFGDGEASDLVNPTKTYEQPGAYPVTLKVRNGTGTEWGSDITRIAALIREGPIASAGADMTVCTNQAVRFDGSGSTDADGAVNAFSWVFGDGGTASGEHPEYSFKKPGNYAVNLTISGEALGNCSPLDTDTVNVEVVAAPAQEIVGSDRAAAGMSADYAVALGDLGGASVINQIWSFSDGGSASGSEVSHVFENPGIYFVTVVTDLAGGNAGCSTIETNRKVVVNAAPLGEIEAPQIVAAGQAILFAADGSSDTDGAIVDFAWDFGDGTAGHGLQAAHSYEKAGEYTVALTIKDDANVGNSVVTTTSLITVNPAPVAGLTVPQWVCPATEMPWEVVAPNGTAITWNFGDGAAKAGSSVTHTFQTPGLYPITIALDDGKGLANSQRQESRYVRVNQSPNAFAGPDQVICPGDTTVFDAGASGDLDGEITAFDWVFSDGVTLSGPRVERRFDQSGPVTVELRVHDNSGLSCGIVSDTAQILVNHTPVIDAGPDLSSKIGGAHDVVDFDGTNASDADGHGLEITWDYGDGTTGTGSVAQHRYTTAGTYTVVATARDTTGLQCGVGQDQANISAMARP